MATVHGTGGGAYDPFLSRRTYSQPKVDHTAEYVQMGTMFANMLGSIFIASAQARAAGGAGGAGGVDYADTNKLIYAAASNVVNNYVSDKTGLVNSFNTKYAQAGISMNADGVPSKSYDQAKADIESEISALKGNVTDEDSSKDGIQNTSKTNYETAKATYEGYKNALQNYDNYDRSIQSFQSKNNVTIMINGDINSDTVSAKGKEPDASKFTQYLTQDQKASCKNANGTVDENKLNELAKNTQKYQDAKRANEDEAEKFNQLVQARKNSLPSGVADKNDLTNKMNDAKKAMDEAGKGVVNSSGQTAAQHDMALQNLQSKLAALGSKADFDAAVKKITDLDSEYQESLKIVNTQKLTDEEATAATNAKIDLKAAKRGGHTGLRGRLYDMFHKDSKTNGVAAAKVDYTNAQNQAQLSQDALQQLYNQYRPHT